MQSPRIRPRATVDLGLLLSDLAILDRENAAVCGVATNTIRRWRRLIHSDGCRTTNVVKKQLRGGVATYDYPRYFFSNESTDILRLCGQALDRLGIKWRYTRRNALSVARQEAVAALDYYVGPKY